MSTEEGGKGGTDPRDDDDGKRWEVKCEEEVKSLRIEIPQSLEAPQVQQRRYSQGSAIPRACSADQADPFPFLRHSSDNIRHMALLDTGQKQDSGKPLKRSWHEEHHFRDLDDIVESPLTKTPADDWPLSYNQQRSMLNQLNIDVPFEKGFVCQYPHYPNKPQLVANACDSPSHRAALFD